MAVPEPVQGHVILTRGPRSRSSASRRTGRGSRYSAAQSFDRCSRFQRVMGTARHGGFADESARGSNCRGANAQHAETSAMTQPIAKPPRRILLAGLLWCAVQSRQRGRSARRDCATSSRPSRSGAGLRFSRDNCTSVASTRAHGRESLLASVFTNARNALRRCFSSHGVLRAFEQPSDAAFITWKAPDRRPASATSTARRPRRNPNARPKHPSRRGTTR